MTDPLVLPSAKGVAAGIADADMVGANAKAQPVNPTIRSRFILEHPPLWQVLLRIIRPFLQCWLNGAFTHRSGTVLARRPIALHNRSSGPMVSAEKRARLFGRALDQ
jgi:hypothetical protein